MNETIERLIDDLKHAVHITPSHHIENRIIIFEVVREYGNTIRLNRWILMAQIVQGMNKVVELDVSMLRMPVFSTDNDPITAIHDKVINGYAMDMGLPAMLEDILKTELSDIWHSDII